jgi:predicted membrane chloride channel (bestrophin family)
MLLLPSAMYDSFADKTAMASSLGNLQCLALIPATVIVGLFLFGIEELAMQLEEPFSILPMQNFCDDVRRSTNTISNWTLNGTQLRSDDG